jgi:hypothetical protein
MAQAPRQLTNPRAQDDRPLRSGPLTRSVVLLATLALAAVAATGLLAHQSDDPAILGRYSLTYLAYVLYNLTIIAWWAGLALIALFRWDKLKQVMIRALAAARGRLYLAAGAVAVLYAASLTAASFAPGPVPPLIRQTPTIFLSVAVLAAAVIAFERFFAGLPQSPPASPVTRAVPWLHRLERPAGWLGADERALLAAAVTTAIGALVLFAPVLVRPGTMAGGGDGYRLAYPFEDYVIQALRAGRIPLWNPYLFSGNPALAHPQTLVFYPLQLIFRFLPAHQSMNWALILHVWLAGFGMALLCRRFGLHPLIALGCALIYMFNGRLTFLVSVGYRWAVFAIALLPWLWLLVTQALEDRNWAATGGAGLLLGATILTGHAAWPFYISLFTGLYALYLCLRFWLEDGSWRRALAAAARFSLIVALGLALSAVEFYPAYVLSRQTILSSGYNLGRANLAALTLPRLISFLVPSPFESMPWEWVTYIGAIPLLAIPYAFARRSARALVVFLSAVFVFTIVMALGRDALLYRWLYRAFPPLQFLRIPPRILVIWVPCATLLAGHGLQALIDGEIDRRWLRLGLGVGAGLALLLTAVLVGALAAGRFGVPGIRIPGAGPLTPASLRLALSVGAGLFILLNLLINRRLWPLAAALAGGGAFFGLRLVGHGEIATTPGTVAVFVAALALVAGGTALLNLMGRYRRAEAVLLLAVALTTLDVYAQNHAHVYAHELPRSPLSDHDVAQIAAGVNGRLLVRTEVLNDTPTTNKYMLDRLNETDGYDSVKLADYVHFEQIARELYTGGDLRWMSFLNVTNVVALERPALDGLEVIAETPGYVLLRNPAALPRVFWVTDVEVAPDRDRALDIMRQPDFDFARTVVLDRPAPVDDAPADGDPTIHITGYDPYSGGITVETVTDRDGVLVFSEPYYSERGICIDGEAVPVYKANAAFMAAALPAGRHVVELVYVPTSFRIGLGLTGAGLLVSLGLVVMEVIRARRRSNVPTNVGG